MSLMQKHLKQIEDCRASKDDEGLIKAYEALCTKFKPQMEWCFNLANALFKKSKWEESQKRYQQAFDLSQKKQPIALLGVARCFVKQAKWSQAQETFLRFLEMEPENFSGWLEIGHVYRHQGLQDKMLKAYLKSVQISPERWEGHLALVRGFEDAALPVDAARAYEMASRYIRNQQHIVQLHERIGAYRTERGDTKAGIEALRQAQLYQKAYQIQVEEQVIRDLHYQQAIALFRLGLHTEALELVERAFQQEDFPEDMATQWMELLFSHNEVEKAIAYGRFTCERYPKSTLALSNLLHMLVENCDFQAAQEVLNQIELLGGLEDKNREQSLKSRIASKQGDPDAALASIIKKLNETPEELKDVERHSLAMTSLYSDRFSAKEVLHLHQKACAIWGENARDRASFANAKDPDRLLRVGLVSGDFHHQHPVNIFMQPLLDVLNKQSLQLVLYKTQPNQDAQSVLVERKVHQTHQVATWTEERLAKQIENDQIDVLIDLAGHTGANRLKLFGQRAAPVQITFLGYPGSTGVPNMDYILVDPIIAPLGSEDVFSEKLLHLPHTVFCYAPGDEYPFPQYEPSIINRPLTFGCFNNPTKVNSHTIELWSAILKQLPQAKLLLKAPNYKDPGVAALFRERFVKHGVKPDQIQFRGPSPLAEMMQEYADIDIALDPMPYNGGTTSLQAMWMGAPVVVKYGEHFVSRMGASFMTAAGLPEWVAQNDEEYIKIAVRQAQDRQGLYELKKQMRARLSSLPAWNIDQYAKDWEAAIRKAWQEYCQT